MSIVKVNKSGMGAVVSELMNKVASLDSEISLVTSTLDSIPAHEDFPDLKSKASLIANSLKNINIDYGYLKDNIKSYVDVLKEIDSEGMDFSPEALAKYSSVNTNFDFNGSNSSLASLVSSTKGNYTYSYSTGPQGVSVSNGLVSNNEVGTLVYSTTVGSTSNVTGNVSRDSLIEMGKIVETEEGTVINVPSGLGSVHTYMGWQMITAKNSSQYKLIESAGMNFDEEGFGKIGDRYVIAVTETFGKVGDFLDVYKEDGTVIKCIIGDIKSQQDAGCNEWGHNNGQNVVEFVVDKNSWYSGSRGGHANPGTQSCHPEWNKNIVKVVNKGNYFDYLNNDKVIPV